MAIIENFILSVIAFFIGIFSKDSLHIFFYHRVQDEKDPFFDSDLDPDAFNWQVKLINDYFTPLNLTDAVQKLKNGKLPERAVVITFDDGYKDNIEEALPILKKYQVPATFFIASGFLNGGIMWNDIIIESIRLTTKGNIDLLELGLLNYSLGSREDKLYAIEDIIKKVKYQKFNEREKLVKKISALCNICLPDSLMMNDKDIIQLYKSGMEIAGHTVNHPILSSETDDIVNKELREGKVYLEQLLDTKLTAFAYPNGKQEKDYKYKHASMVKKAGFSCAVTTNWGINDRETDSMQLKRFTPWDNSRIMFLLRILKLYMFNKA